MKSIRIRKGLDLPISGRPEQRVRQGRPIKHVALIGEDYAGMRPTMLVKEGDRVQTGQVLFQDKKNLGVNFCAPGCGKVVAINRGARRKFESLVIELAGNDSVRFFDRTLTPAADMAAPKIRKILIESGMWASFRTRPYGKIPAIHSTPASLFITAIDTSPLASDPQVIIAQSTEAYQFGLKIIRRLISIPIHYCTAAPELLPEEKLSTLQYYRFQGPHPAGLPSTHIHFIDPVHEEKTVWHIDYQDIIALGHLFLSGYLYPERTIALGGSSVTKPALLFTRLGASLPELCDQELSPGGPWRILSGSVLNGREAAGSYGFLGRYHNQVSILNDNNGRGFLNWAAPGKDRFSIKPLFASALTNKLRLPFSTALWGGKREIYPLGTYEDVMPLDIIATSLLKALATGDTEKSKDLGCLELIEEDFSLCSFVCPGKNEFGPSLRQVLTAIERGD